MPANRSWPRAVVFAVLGWAVTLALTFAVNPFWMARCPKSQLVPLSTTGDNLETVTALTCVAEDYSHDVVVSKLIVYLLAAGIAAAVVYLFAPTRRWLSVVIVFPLSLYLGIEIFTSPAGVLRYLSLWFTGSP